MRGMRDAILGLLFLTACTGCDNNKEAFPDPAFKACVEKELASQSSFDNTTYSISDDEDLEVIKVLACDGDVKSIKGAEKLANMYELGLYKNSVESVEPLRGLKKLTTLDLRINKLTDVSPLATVASIGYLQLSANYITDITPLKTLTNMGTLYIDNNCISDVETQCNELTTAIPNLDVVGKEYQMDAERCQ